MEIGGLIAPTVVGAVVSGLVSFIVSREANRLVQKKLDNENELGNARLSQEKALSEQRIKSDADLIEMKETLARKLSISESRRGFAESVLADFYRAQSILIDCRRAWMADSNVVFKLVSGDTKNRSFADLAPDIIPVVQEKLRENAEFFATLRVKKTAAMVSFAVEAGHPFDEINEVHSRILRTTYNLQEAIRLNADREDRGFVELLSIVCTKPTDKEDPLGPEIKRAVVAIEEICRRVIKETLDLQVSLS